MPSSTSGVSHSRTNTRTHTSAYSSVLTPAKLASRAGRLPRGIELMERLETRTLMAGDHPSLPVGPTPWAADAIAIDFMPTPDSSAFGRGVATGVIAAGDPGDLFRFDMPTVMQGGKAKDFVTILADTIPGSSTLDSFVEVYSSTGQLIASGSNNGTVSIGVTTNPTLPKSPDGWAGFEGVAGARYYVRVRADSTIGNGRTNTGAYTLRLDTITVPIAIDNASTNPAIFGTGRETTTIAFAQDEVVYSYTTPNDARFDSLSTLQAATLDTSMVLVNPHLDLYSAGNANGQVSRLTGDADAGRQTDAFATYRSTKNTTYYLRVRSDDYRTTTPNTATGAFTAFIRAAATTLDIDPVTRLGETTATQQIVGADNSPGAPLDGSGLRLYRFQAQGTGRGIVTVIGGGLVTGDGLLTPSVRMYDTTGLSIDFDKALVGTAQIETPVVGGQSYYVVIEGFDSAPDTTNNTRDGVVRLFVEGHHTFDPLLGSDDHIDATFPGSRLAWEDATPIRFGDPEQLQEVFSSAGQTPVLSTDRQDHSWIQTGTGRGRLATAGDSDLYQFTPPVSQLSDYEGDSATITPALYVGGNFATAGQDRVSGINRKRNNTAIYDANDWWDSGPVEMTTGTGSMVDGPIDGPIFAQTIWDPDGTGGYDPILVAAGNFTNVYSIVDQGGGNLVKTVVAANLAFRTFLPTENRYIWCTTIGFRQLPGVTPPAYTTASDPITINGSVFALKPFNSVPNGNTNLVADELFIGGQFTNIGGVANVNSIGQLQWVPSLTVPGAGALIPGALGGQANSGVVDAGGNAGIVRALEVYDPSSPMQPTFPPPTPPMGQMFVQQPDQPAGLYIGGLFARAQLGMTNTTAGNVVRWGLAAPQQGGGPPPNVFQPLEHIVWNETTTPPSAVTNQGVTASGASGGVFTLKAMDSGQVELFRFQYGDPAQMPNTADIPNRLYIGGAFTRNALTNIAVSAPQTNLVAYDGNHFVGLDAAMPLNITGTVRALESWRVTEDLMTTGPRAALVVAFDTAPVPPGAQFAPSSSVQIWYGQTGARNAWTEIGQTPDGAILSLAVVEENELATQAPYEQLYIGGSFTQVITPGMPPNPHVNLNRVARFTVFSQGQWQLDWSGLTTGLNGLSDPPPTSEITTAAYSLQPFADERVGIFRRNSRPGTRAQIRVNRLDDSQETLNLFVSVYDSKFNLLYTNDSVDLNNADPAGANNPAFPAVAIDGGGFEMPETWAGEVYYIEVTGGGTGRYELEVITEALPPKDQTNPNGQYADTYSSITKPVGQGVWSDAVSIPLDGAGFGRNFTLDVNGGPWSDGRANSMDADLPGANVERTYIRDLQGWQRYQFEELPSISRADETHLYQFRAPNDGTVEIRLATKDITSAWQEQIIDELDPARNFAVASNKKLKAIDSPLHAALRVFTNDQSTGQFVQTGFSNYNYALAGFEDTIPSHTPNNLTEPPDGANRTFTATDPRVVIPVQRGNVYFIQVESAFKALFESNPDLVDWRFATGAYEILVRATPALNGIDDHPNATPITTVNDSSIPVDPQTGIGSITGVIANVTTGPFLNPNDSDTFRYIADNKGQVRITVTPNAAGLTPRVQIFRLDGTNPATVAGTTPGQAINATFTAAQGEVYFIAVSGVGGTQGAYTVGVQAPGLTDDQAFSDATPINNSAPITGWANAKPLTINRFLGAYGIPDPLTGRIVDGVSGEIENANDRDIFKFTAEAYELATVTVEQVSLTLNPFVFVYEISKDNAGNDVFLQIARNDDGPNAPDARANFSTTPGRTYYIIVTGTDTSSDLGFYNLRINVVPTDDHPDRLDFPLGTDISLAFDSLNFTSTGAATGRIERVGDTDLFRFTAPADGSANVTLSNRNSSTLALAVTLLDSSNLAFPGNRVSYSIGGGGAVTVRLSGITSGTQYYILVQSGTPGSGQTNTGDYALAVSTSPVDDHANQGQFGQATVIPLSPTTGSGQATGMLVPTGDTDLFRFTTLVNGTVTVRAGSPSSTLNPRLVIFNSSFVQTAATDGNGDSSTITFNVLAGQVYYALVLASTGASGATAVGSFQVTVSNVTGGGNNGPDDYPNAGEFNDAALIALDNQTGTASVNALINYAGDTDLFRFVPAASGAVDLQVNIPVGGPVDAALKVFDSARNLIFQDTVGSGGSTASVSYNAVAGQTYYVLVEPVGSAVGSYVLRVAAQPATNFYYYPEGFRGGNINEFLKVVNPNNFAVTYSVYVRYESGANDPTPLYVDTIAANSTGGKTLTQRTGSAYAALRSGVGYALEIRSNGALGATFSHYDFGASLGENFTSQTSTTWTFAEVHKDTANFRDFLVFYNPGSTAATITLDVYYTNGTRITIPATVDALRRGGINIESDSRFNTGVFGVKVTSSTPIVAALTSYDIPRSGGTASLGDASGGATKGVLPGISSGAGNDSSFTFLNTNSTPTSVTFVVGYARIDLTPVTTTISIPANSIYSASFSSLGIVAGQRAGISYTAAAPLTLSVTEYQNGDADRATTATTAARAFTFSDIFIDPAEAGTNFIQRLSLYNPTSQAIDVTGLFIFEDGATSTITVRVEALNYAFVQLDQQPAVLARATPTTFGMLLNSTQPFVSSLLNYQLLLDGGWTSLGQPIGLLTPLASI